MNAPRGSVVADSVFADSNVILDIATGDPRWSVWSSDQLRHWLDAGRVLINPIVYGEIAFACDRIEEVDELLPPELFHDRPIPRAGAFLAARAHADYRSRGGQRTAVLPDFLIGAHAVVEGCPLLTRDPRRYRQAFPGLALITP